MSRPRTIAMLVERSVVKLAKLMTSGKSETEEADTIRERIFDDWKLLTEEEREITDNLSGDLYALDGTESYVESTMTAEEQLAATEAAMTARDHVVALECLRRMHGAPNERLRCSGRAAAYGALGYKLAAKCFADRAFELALLPASWPPRGGA